MRKPRIQSKISKLTIAQREQVHTWFRDPPMTLAEIAARIKKEFGVSIATSSLSEYHKKYGTEILRAAQEPAARQTIELNLVVRVEIRPIVVHPTNNGLK